MYRIRSPCREAKNSVIEIVHTVCMQCNRYRCVYGNVFECILLHTGIGNVNINMYNRPTIYNMAKIITELTY